MTQNTLSVNTPKNKTFSFFTKELLSGKIALLLWGVVFFTAVTVPSLYEVSSSAGVEALSARRLLRDLCGPFFTGTYFMMLAGLISGITAFSIYSGKRSAYFYLSLPVKRDTLFLARLTAGAVPPILAFLLNALISIFIFASSHHYTVGSCFWVTSKIIGQALLMFLWVYAVTVLAASLTSRSVATAFLAAWMFAFVPIYFFCTTVVLNLSVPDAYAPWASSEIPFTHFNPLLRMIMLHNQLGDSYASGAVPVATIYSRDYAASLAWYETLAIIIGSALLITAAMLISRKRPAENAGESAAFPRIGELIKLTALIPAGILFGLFFSELFGIIGLYGGIIWGVFVVFLILNLLLCRSGKKLFVGAKTAIILTLILLPFILCAQLFGAYTDSRVYTTENTKGVEVYVHPFDYIKIDMDKSEELLGLIAGIEENDSYTYLNSVFSGAFSSVVAAPEDVDFVSVYNYYYDDSFNLRVRIKPKMGIAVEKSYKLYAPEDKEILFNAIRASSDDGILLLAKLFPVDEPEFSYNNYCELSYTDTPLYQGSTVKEELRPTREAVIAIAERRIMEFINKTDGGFSIGTINYPASSGYVTLPFYAEDLPLLSGTTTADLDELAKHIESIKIFHEYYELFYKYSEGAIATDSKYPESDLVAEITDKNKIKEYLSACAGVSYSYHSTSGMINPISSGIHVEVNGKYGTMYFTFNTRFRKDRVPAEIQEMVDAMIEKYSQTN